MTTKQTTAQEILEALAQSPQSSVGDTDWSLSGSSHRALVLRELHQHGAIVSDSQLGRSNGTTHTITESGRMLLIWLRRGDLNISEYWNIADIFKWALVLREIPLEERNKANWMEYNPIERAGLFYAWNGSIEHREILEEIGGREVKAILWLTSTFVKDMPLPDVDFDALIASSELANIPKTEVQRVGAYLFYYYFNLRLQVADSLTKVGES